MPPLIVEASLALALAASIVKLTSTVNRIEANQERARIELLGKHEVIKVELETLKTQYYELKQELKDSRRYRQADN